MPTIKVDITGDAGKLSKAFGEASGSAGKFEGVMAKLGKAAIVTGAALAGGFAVVLKNGFNELAESQKVTAQTKAVLESTGNAAKVSAKQITDLASAISQKSGIDDEAIQSGQNMLLTFTNIRNEVGAGNDIFNQATSTITDMSVALGQDMKSSAIQLGKALNDPVKGMTALQRVGVTFTAEQKKTVAEMVKTGDTMGAQKLILAELNKEFGGSAAAYGKTLPGALSKLRNAFDEVSGAIAAKLLPVVMGAVAMIQANMSKIEQVANTVMSGVGAVIRTVAIPALEALVGVIPKAVAAFQKIAGAVQDTVGWFKQHQTVTNILVPIMAGLATGIVAAAVAMKVVSTATAVWAAAQAILNIALTANPIGIVIVALAALAAAVYVAYTRSETFREIVNGAFAQMKAVVLPIIAALQEAWKKWGDEVIKVAQTSFGVLKSVVENALRIVRGVVDMFVGVFTGDWSRAWNGMKAVATGAINIVLASVRAFGPLLLAAAKALGAAILKGVVAGLEGLGNLARDKLNALRQTVAGFASGLYGNALAVGKAIIRGIGDGINNLLGWLLDQAGGIVKKVKDKLMFWESPPEAFGAKIGARLISGLVNGLKSGQAAAVEQSGMVVKAIIGEVTKLNREIDRIAEQRAAQDRRNAVTQAQAAVAAAVKEGKGVAEAKLALFRAEQDIELAQGQKRVSALEANLEKLANAIEKRKERFQAAWDKIAAAALDAWDKRYAGMQTAAEKQLALIERTEAERGRREALAAAQRQLAAATTDEERLSALEAVRQAELAITVAKLTEQAEAERKAADALNEKKRAAFEKALAILEAHLEKTGASQKQAHAAIMALYQKFGIDYGNAGANLGQSFVNGITSKIPAAKAAAAQLAAAGTVGAGSGVGGVATQSTAGMTVSSGGSASVSGSAGAGSGVGTLPGRMIEMAAGGIVRRPTFAMVGEAGPEAVIPLSRARGIGGVVNNYFSFPNYVGSKQELVSLVQRELIRNGKRNGGGILGGYA